MKPSEIISLILSAAALVVAYVALKTGATENNQQAEIDSIVVATHRIQQGLDDQVVTNGLLLGSFKIQLKTDSILDSSLIAQQSELSILHSSLNAQQHELSNSERQLSIILADKAYAAHLDSLSFNLGLKRLISTFEYEMPAYYQMPLDTLQNFGQLFDQKLTSIEAQVISLASNRLMSSRIHLDENLSLLLDAIDQTHIYLAHYGYRYKQVDSAIAICFQSISVNVKYITFYSPSTDEPFKDPYRITISALRIVPAKVFQMIKNNN